MNLVCLMGNLVADPELKQVGETQVCSFRIAVPRNYVKRGEERGADFFNCSAWGQTGVNLAKLCTKGTKIGIDGEIRNHQWEKDGVKRVDTQVWVRSFDIAKRAEIEEPPREAPTDEDDELPF